MNKKLTYTFGALGIAGLSILGTLKIQKPTDTIVTLPNNNATAMLATINATEFASRTDTEHRTLIDVRTPQEYAEGHIAGAVNIDLYADSFMDDIHALEKNKPYAIYCRSGNRSGQTLLIMEEMGFADVIDLGGGIVSWRNAGNELCMNC